MAKYYATKTDAIAYEIENALIPYQDDFDLEGIANAVLTYHEGKGYRLDYHGDAFWAIVEQYEVA